MVEHAHAAPAPVTWWKRENLAPGLVLLLLTILAWAYTLRQSDTMLGMAMAAPAPLHDATAMHGMEPSAATAAHAGMAAPEGAMDSMRAEAPARTGAQPAVLSLFLLSWTVMMVAMMLPAALPLILLYRIIARKRPGPRAATAGMAALLLGYVGVWSVAGLPVYAYHVLIAATSPLLAAVPGLLLIAGGVYQFTALKHGCHTRCSNPLFFLMNQWRSGVGGAFRLGVLHGIDCLGCCVGLMLALVALGMMQVAWMLTAAVIIFVEKTLPGGHRVARPLGVALVIGGIALLGVSLRGGLAAL